MKSVSLWISILVTAVLLGSSAYAKPTNKGTLDLTEKVSIGGKALTPGTYKVEWTGTGNRVQVTLLQGKETVATFPARLTKQSISNEGNAYGTTAQADGSRKLTAIYFSGKKDFLEINQKAAARHSKANATKR